MYYSLTKEQLDGIVAFINKEEGSRLDTEAAQVLLSTASAVGAALMRENKRLLAENASVRRRLSRISERKQADSRALVESDAFEGTGLDSVDVAKATLYRIQELGVKVSQNKFMLLLYLSYCSYLYHQNKRLFVEGPVALEHGPIFWRVSKKIASVVTPVERDAWTKLASQSPSVAKFVWNYMQKYADHTEGDLKRLVLYSSPFKIAMDMARGKGRKSFEINDKDIWLWREKLNK